jgi:hypothetical protein
MMYVYKRAVSRGEKLDRVHDIQRLATSMLCAVERELMFAFVGETETFWTGIVALERHFLLHKVVNLPVILTIRVLCLCLPFLSLLLQIGYCFDALLFLHICGRITSKFGPCSFILSFIEFDGPLSLGQSEYFFFVFGYRSI